MTIAVQSPCHVVADQELEFEMLVYFKKEQNRRACRNNGQSTDENQQQTLPTYGDTAGIEP